MEGVGGAAAQERRQEAEEKTGRRQQDRAAGGMKFRVSARAPHGVGALLLIGGAVLAGAAVVAWRHARRGKRDQQPAKREEVADGGVVEEGKAGASALEIDQPDDKVQGIAPLLREIVQPDDDLRAEEEKTKIGSNGLDGVGVTEAIQEVHDDEEILVDESFQSSEQVQKIDLDLGKSSTEVLIHDDVFQSSEQVQKVDLDLGKSSTETPMHGDVFQSSEQVQKIDLDLGNEIPIHDGVFQSSEQVQKIDLDLGKSSTEIPIHDDVDSEHVERFDQDSSTELPEITTYDMDSVTAEKGDENPMRNDTENDDDSTKNDIENDQDPTTNHMESDNASENDLKKEIGQTEDEDVEASDERSHSISRPGIILLDEQSVHGGGAQEAESMENSPTAQLMVHPEQLLDDTEGETVEAKPGEGTVVSDEDAHNQQEGQQKAMAEPAELAGSPALSSLVAVKPAEKKRELEIPGWIETGMKIEQDYTNGEVKEHGLISRGGVTPGGVAGVTVVDRSSSIMAVLALMLALTIGITIVVRFYVPPRATRLVEMGLQ